MFTVTTGKINVPKHFPTGNKITVHCSWADSKPEGCTVETREKWPKFQQITRDHGDDRPSTIKHPTNSTDHSPS